MLQIKPGSSNSTGEHNIKQADVESLMYGGHESFGALRGCFLKRPAIDFQLKEAGKVYGRDPPQLKRIRFVKLCQTARDLDDAGRLIASPTKRHRRQIRAIGLDQQPLQRNAARDRAQILRLLKGHVARKRDHKAKLKQALGHLPRAAEAMHAPALRRTAPLRAQDIDGILIGLARMDDDGKAGGASQDRKSVV